MTSLFQSQHGLWQLFVSHGVLTVKVLPSVLTAAFTSFNVALAGRDSQHTQTEKTTGQAGSGLRLGQDEVCRPRFIKSLHHQVLTSTGSHPNLSNSLYVVRDKHAFLNNISPSRWYQATRSNNQAMAARIDSLKDEMDEAVNKVEICKVAGASSLGRGQTAYFSLKSLVTGAHY